MPDFPTDPKIKCTCGCDIFEVVQIQSFRDVPSALGGIPPSANIFEYTASPVVVLRCVICGDLVLPPYDYGMLPFKTIKAFTEFRELLEKINAARKEDGDEQS